MRYKAIIFDMNGTLLRDSELHEIAWIEVAKQLRDKPLTIEEFQKNGHGLTNMGIITYLMGSKPNDNQFNRIVELKEGMYRNMCLQNKGSFKLAPGVKDFLNKVKEANIPITIATGSYKTNVEFYFEHLQLGNWFNINKVVLDNGTYMGKPKPFVYLKAAAILNVSPKDCIVFEDSYSGIKAATNAGIGRIITVESNLEPHKVQEIAKVYKMVNGFLDMELSILNN